jgi:hypothetical protein
MALNAGYSSPIVMALGGWKTERMMRRYGNGAVTLRRIRLRPSPYKAEVGSSILNPAPAYQ